MDARLLEILACPICDSRPPLRLENGLLICTECGHGFPIVDDIPHLLPESAITPEEVQTKLHGGDSA